MEGAPLGQDEVGKLFDGHAARAFRYARAMGLSRDEADDVVGESFLRVLVSLESFRGDAPFAAWLLTIVRNQVVDMMRAQSRRRAREERAVGKRKAVTANGPDKNSREKEMQAAVGEALVALEPDERAALSLVTAGELTYREAAEAEGVSLSALASRVFRARRALRELLAGRGLVEA